MTPSHTVVMEVAFFLLLHGLLNVPQMSITNTKKGLGPMLGDPTTHKSLVDQHPPQVQQATDETHKQLMKLKHQTCKENSIHTPKK